MLNFSKPTDSLFLKKTVGLFILLVFVAKQTQFFTGLNPIALYHCRRRHHRHRHRHRHRRHRFYQHHHHHPPPPLLLLVLVVVVVVSVVSVSVIVITIFQIMFRKPELRRYWVCVISKSEVTFPGCFQAVLSLSTLESRNVLKYG